VELTFGSLAPVLPEIILIFGGLLILLLDTFVTSEGDTGRGYWAVTVLFLIVGTAAVMLQMGADIQTAVYTVSIDPFASFTKVIAYIAMLMVAVAGGGFINKYVHGRGEFWSSYLFLTAAMSFAVAANNLILVFVAVEFLSITSYILVGSVREDNKSSEAGLKYFLYGSVASAAMLYGMTILYGVSGSLYLAEIGAVFAENPDLLIAALPAAILIMAGLGFKASLAPFFQWTPDTYEGAPTPVAAYLSTASKAVGFAVIARLLLVVFSIDRLDWVPLLGALAVLTMFAGNLMALRQTNVKRMLAYSSIAQAGYMVMGLASMVDRTKVDVNTLSMNGLNGVLVYLFAYVFTNIGAFIVVMAIENMTGGTELKHFTGLSKRAPALAFAMLVFLLSLTGIPLTGGFIGKFLVFGATIQQQYYWLAAAAVVNVGISAYYYLNVAKAMYFSGDTEPLPEDTAGPGFGAQAIILVCLLGVFWVGIYQPNVIDWANTASRYLMTIP
jgi:proton-translocating NADH-quinone oxidoreductase chain N